jgi:type II secretory pathway pseudopilin PulG
MLELTVAVSILTVGALMLSATIATSERANTLARERAVANGAVRSYIERMRQEYPAQGFPQLGATGMDALVWDTTTPVTDLLLSGPDRNVLRSPVATVYTTTDETGQTWTNGLTSDATVAPLSSRIPVSDRAALGLPRDLDGNGTQDNSASAPYSTIFVPPGKASFVPARIELSWLTGSDAGGCPRRARLTVYVSFGPQH